MVMILLRSVLLIKSIIVASVVLFPLPVVPVKSVRPRSDKAMSLITSGKFISSIDGMVVRMTRMTTAQRAQIAVRTAAEASHSVDHVREIKALRHCRVEVRRHSFGRQRRDGLRRLIARSTARPRRNGARRRAATSERRPPAGAGRMHPAEPRNEAAFLRP